MPLWDLLRRRGFLAIGDKVGMGPSALVIGPGQSGPHALSIAGEGLLDNAARIGHNRNI